MLRVPGLEGADIGVCPECLVTPPQTPVWELGQGQRVWAPLRSACRALSLLGSGIVPEHEHRQESCAVTACASWQGQGQSGPLTEEAWGACSVVDLLSPFYNKGKGNGDCAELLQSDRW